MCTASDQLAPARAVADCPNCYAVLCVEDACAGWLVCFDCSLDLDARALTWRSNDYARVR